VPFLTGPAILTDFCGPFVNILGATGGDMANLARDEEETDAEVDAEGIGPE
jgi:hypothetical protein